MRLGPDYRADGPDIQVVDSELKNCSNENENFDGNGDGKLLGRCISNDCKASGADVPLIKPSNCLPLVVVSFTELPVDSDSEPDIKSENEPKLKLERKKAHAGHRDESVNSVNDSPCPNKTVQVTKEMMAMALSKVPNDLVPESRTSKNKQTILNDQGGSKRKEKPSECKRTHCMKRGARCDLGGFPNVRLDPQNLFASPGRNISKKRKSEK